MEPYLQVISMLVSKTKLTLITTDGTLVHVAVDGEYNTNRIIEDLTPSLNGLDPVDFLLSNYSVAADAIKQDVEGIVTVVVIDGKEVEGVFYPSTTGVKVKLDDKDVTIPDISPLADQMRRASDEDSDAVRNFLIRLAPVIDERRHSGEDLLSFIKTSELPLTHDGKLIAYKRVNRHVEPGYYVDCHTGQIRQRIGSRVTMPVDMVDPSRHKSCSTGLHVANLDYMKGFYGSDTLIVLVDPANFIAVPLGEDSKARVSSYDIIGTISDGAHNAVNSGVHAEDVTLEELIKEAVLGNSLAPIEEIFVGVREITEIKSLAPVVEPTVKKKKKKKKKSKKTSGKSLRTDGKVRAAKVIKVRKDLLKAKGHSVLDNAIEVTFQRMADDPDLSVAFVANAMGISKRTIERWMEEHDYESWLADYLETDHEVPDETPESEVTGSTEEDPETQEEAEQEAKVEEVEPIVPVDTDSEEEDTPAGQEELVVPADAQDVKRTKLGQATYDLFEAWQVTESEADLNALIAHKKLKKKGWAALGLTEAEINTILACV